MEQEVGIKLTAPSPAVLDAILNDPEIIRLSGDQTPLDHSYSAHYVDTAGHDLLRQRFAFRTCRRKPGEVMASLKGGGSVVNGVGQWQEEELILPAPISRADELPEGALRTRLCAMLPADALLKHLLATHIRRRAMQLQLEADTRVELALDHGHVEAGDQTRPICEVELEWLAGDFALVEQLAERLTARHGLSRAKESKFSAGLTLLGIGAGFDGGSAS